MSNRTNAAQQELEAGLNSKCGYTPMQDTSTSQRTLAIADHACSLIAPLWGLSSFVAVNPFWGMRDKPFVSAITNLPRYTPKATLPQSSLYQAAIDRSPHGSQEFLGALRKLNPAAQASATSDSLNPARTNHQRVFEGVTVAGACSEQFGFDCGAMIVDEIGKFLALYFDRGQAALPSPLPNQSMWSSWLWFASVDRSLEVLGFAGARDFFKSLSALSAEQVIEQFASLMALPHGDSDNAQLLTLFGQELFAMHGWVAYLQHLDFEQAKKTQAVNRKDSRVRTALAIRCAYNLLLLNRSNNELLLARLRAQIAALTERTLEKPTGEWIEPIAAQIAAERLFVRSLATRLIPAPGVAPVGRAKLQALFCIDVRSEGLRRALETQSPEIETYGFAGFFGLTFGFTEAGSHQSVEQYPVLLNRSFTVRECVCGTESHLPEALSWGDRASNTLGLLIRLLRQSVCSGFSYVESLGAWYSFRMLASTFARRRPIPISGTRSHDRLLEIELPVEERAAAAIRLLKNSGLRQPYAPLVLLCGHRGAATNNPYAAGLDCGACGGHGGESNARVAAMLLNDPSVRAKLRGSEFEIPTDTRFVPAVHITTTDEVELLETYDLDLDELQIWLKGASELNRQQLIVALSSGHAIDHAIDNAEQELLRRAADWSEVRPEWALARNAGFIAARRARSREVALGNRCFLHEYDYRCDPDGSILELIMTAPLVVASWINLQYYGSSVMPELFGSGTKTIHNVVGQFGTVLGNGGDLGFGLPLQSVHTGRELFHEPLRLQVVIEAPTAKIEQIIAKHALLQQLINNEWVILHALNPDGSEIARRESPDKWTLL